jgi:hypothetical protein
MKSLCEDTLAHQGNTVIPFARFRVSEAMGGVGYDEKNESTHEYNVCLPCAEFLTASTYMRISIVADLYPEAQPSEEHLRAEGRIMDPVPVGSNSAKQNWTGLTVTPIVRAESLFRRGRMTEVKFRAIVTEVGRLGQRRKQREAAQHANEADRQYGEGLISKSYLYVMLADARNSAIGVSLAKV